MVLENWNPSRCGIRTRFGLLPAAKELSPSVRKGSPVDTVIRAQSSQYLRFVISSLRAEQLNRPESFVLVGLGMRPQIIDNG